MMHIEINTNKLRALKAAEALAPDSIAYGDDACSIRCAAAWSVLTDSVIAQARSACREIYVVTPQLLPGAAEVARFASLVADLIAAGFSGIIINNLGLLEALRRDRPGIADQTRLIAGRRINCYNSGDLGVLARMGFTRATVTVELNATHIATLQPPPGLTLSMIGYGPLSLAYSRMCYTMSLKGEVDYETCGIACEKESLDFGAQDQNPVFRLYGREILSTRRFCTVRALHHIHGRIGVLEVYFPNGDAAAEVRLAMDLLKDASEDTLDDGSLTLRESELAAATPFGLCNGALFGLPGVSYARESASQRERDIKRTEK